MIIDGTEMTLQDDVLSVDMTVAPSPLVTVMTEEEIAKHIREEMEKFLGKPLVPVLHSDMADALAYTIKASIENYDAMYRITLPMPPLEHIVVNISIDCDVSEPKKAKCHHEWIQKISEEYGPCIFCDQKLTK